MEATYRARTDGTETPLPTYEHHLFCDENGLFPAEMNDWEARVLQRRCSAMGFSFWYRNPSRATQDSLAIAYFDNDQYKIVRPDFVFLARSRMGVWWPTW